MRAAIPAALFVFCLMLLGFGCELVGDSSISGRVTDSVTGAPIDSVQVYSSLVDRPPSWEEPERVEQGVTDEDGHFFFLTPGKGIYIVEVRKEGYDEAPPQTVKGGGEINFVLVRGPALDGKAPHQGTR